MKKVLLVCFALMGITLVESCSFCGEFSKSFNWKNLDVVPIRKIAGSQLSLGQKIRYDSVQFHFKIDKEYLAFHSPTVFSSSLYACDPAPPISNQRISEIIIYSNYVYSTSSRNFNPGANLVEIFAVLGVSIEQFLSNQPLEDDFHLTIGIPPTEQRNHDFTFSIKLDDGRIFDKKVTLIITP
jgi:hypothetical protein